MWAQRLLKNVYVDMKLAVVTDIYDLPLSSSCLSSHFSMFSEVTRYSLNALCGQADLVGEALHTHLFQNGGIEDAAQALCQVTNDECIGLGYSAGGTAIWRASATEAPFKAIFCISSTRLREETPISIPNQVFFGEHDTNKPSHEWLTKVPGNWTILKNAGHNFYCEQSSDAARETSEQISRKLLEISRTKERYVGR